MGTRESGFTPVPSRLPEVRQPAGSRRSGTHSGTSTSIASPLLAVSPTPTSSKPRYRERSRLYGSSPPIRPSLSPTTQFSSRRSRTVEFLVVQDGFHPTPTSDFADLVLPAAIWGEKERHLHQLRAPYQQGQSCSSLLPAMLAPTSTSSSPLQKNSAFARSSIPTGRLPHDAFRSGNVSPPDACATTVQFYLAADR